MREASAGPLLEVSGLWVSYGLFTALRDVSLQVPAGSVTAIVGANGAGKSSLLRAIAGLVAAQQGRIAFGGEDLTAVPAHARARRGISLVPEGRRLFGDMTVLENLRTGALSPQAKVHREETLEEVFDLFPILRERQRQRARTLSGGEQQMLAIGRALMGRPVLLMLDEPSLGLAPVIVRQLFDIVRRLRERGLTILLVEQNVRQSLMVADRACVLERGVVTLTGTGQELLENEYVVDAYVGLKGHQARVGRPR